jgi:hypothetical protein
MALAGRSERGARLGRFERRRARRTGRCNRSAEPADGHGSDAAGDDADDRRDDFDSSSTAVDVASAVAGNPTRIDSDTASPGSAADCLAFSCRVGFDVHPGAERVAAVNNAPDAVVGPHPPLAQRR